MCYDGVLRLDPAFGADAEIKLLKMNVVWWEGGKVKFTAEYAGGASAGVLCTLALWMLQDPPAPRRNSPQWAGASRSHSDTPHSVGFLRSSGQLVHALDGIRTRNPSKRAATDPRLRPRDFWGRHFWLLGKGLMAAWQDHIHAVIITLF